MRRFPEPPLALTVFMVGLSILGAEIAAARLLAPYFGDSTIIWANTIGIVLVALSAGYWYGGKLADRNPSPRMLYRIVLVAGLLLGAVPFVADPFLELAVGALDSISAGAFVGSLVAVLVLIAVPVFVSGTVAPYALRLAIEKVEDTGSVSGRLYAISTIGSLLGTMTSSLLFIPFLGTQRTFLVYGLALVLIAVAGLAQTRLVLAPAALVALLAVPVGTVKAETADGARVIYDTQTTYQYARVVEDADGTRSLELNEGQAVHSQYVPGSFLTGNIWDEYLIVPFAGRDTPPEKIAILGNAAGTTARAYGRFFPGTEIDGVEIDGKLSEIGREYFDMGSNPDLETHTADARPYLRQTDERYDAIMVDAYRQPYIPFYLATEEFFELVRDRLNPGGVVVVNVGHPEGNDDLEKVLGATLASVFDTVVRDPSEDTNTLLLGTMGSASAQRLAANVPSLPPELQPLAVQAAGRIEERLRGGDVYTDDRAPVEWLIDASILEVAANGERGR